ncbi:flagellar biosynthetic protein FliO [Ammoniphilus sp. CFH 90114]|uniref:flagellar biosynthetic protein FliO n=1 Tax=Ammoniphilus sp. CFH 90114 TaxID=2493665 RepID=UPI00100EF3AE|nr:flagellar biosynthetic protein FliO [Ammoniphilus sp. CFH 90114]RXT15125.1 hypothetical protein EIZ39_02645 [Ammoniphilus sp. CFH 90114]
MVSFTRLYLIILFVTSLVLFSGSYIPDVAMAENKEPTVHSKLGEEVNQEQIGNVGADFEVLPYLLKVVFFLIVIGLMIYFLIRFLSNQSRQSIGGLPLRLLGGIALGQNRSLQVVQLGGKVYVLGVGQDVRLLMEIENEEEVAEWLTKEADAPSLMDFMNKWKKKNTHTQDASFEQVFEQQLNQLKENRSVAERTLYYSTDGKEGKNHES